MRTKLFAAALALATAASAQQTWVPGLWAGYTVAQVGQRRNEDLTISEIGRHIGVSLDWFRSGRLEWQARLRYHDQGRRQLSPINRMVTYFPDYTELWLGVRFKAARVRVQQFAYFNPYLTIGRGTGRMLDSTGERPMFKQPGFRRIEAGIGFLFGYQLNMGLFLESGMNIGLNNFYKPPGGRPGFYNWGFSIANLGYRFQHFRKRKNR